LRPLRDGNYDAAWGFCPSRQRPAAPRVIRTARHSGVPVWPTSYVRKSGQGWKLALAGVLLFVGGGLVLGMAGGLGDGLEPGRFIALLLAGLFVSLGGGLAWPAYSIRCRVCELKLFWHAVAARPHDEGLLWVLVVESCPRCGATR